MLCFSSLCHITFLYIYLVREGIFCKEYSDVMSLINLTIDIQSKCTDVDAVENM